MQPLNYYPQPDRPSNPSPLEMAFYNFQLKAKAFYDKKLIDAGSKDPKVIDKLNQDYQHLEKEKNRLAYIVTAQESLRKYREYNADKSTSARSMMKELHHPAADKLGKYLTASGEPKPTVKHEAHHIIPGLGSKAMRPRLQLARLTMHTHGIGVNDPMNGVWLYAKEDGKEFDWATPNASSHRKIHRYNYDRWVALTFRGNLDKLNFVNLLNELKVRIKNGMMPSNVLMKKDESWDGK